MFTVEINEGLGFEGVILPGVAIASRAFRRNTLGDPVLLSYTEIRLDLKSDDAKAAVWACRWKGGVGAAQHVALTMRDRRGLCHTFVLYI